MGSRKVRLEQAVYGSFPFWNRGYAVLARSSGCRPEWLAALRSASQRYGERPMGAPEADGLFALRLRCGSWMIVGVSAQGCDDRDRPGALAFHALFVGAWTYWWSGGNPFVFSGDLRRHWTAADLGTPLPSYGRINPPLHVAGHACRSCPTQQDRVTQAVAALSRGRHVIVQSAEPIDTLAREVWRVLPRRVRCRASVATWAFDNANQFDLVALPKLAGVILDSSALILSSREQH
ncbi:MAG: hypothetical protein ACLQIB_27175 [Isosphaeraceae bacterium]